MAMKVVIDAIDFTEYEPELCALLEKICENEQIRLVKYLKRTGNSEFNEIQLIEQTKQNLLITTMVMSIKLQRRILDIIDNTDKKLAEYVLEKEAKI